MSQQGDGGTDETAPIAAVPPSGWSLEKVTPRTPVPAAPVPAPTTPAGWYPLDGEQRYWDGQRWTEHRAPAVIQPYRPAYVAPVVVTDARTNGVEVAISWILTVLTFGYMLPWAIAATRGKSNSGAVGLLNFFVGWTVIGWIASLVMACTAHQVTAVYHRT